MGRKVHKARLEKVRKALLENKDYKTAMKEAGYSENTAKMGVDNKVIQEALTKNSQAQEKKGLTADYLIEQGLQSLTLIQSEIDNSRGNSRRQWLNTQKGFMEVFGKHMLPTKIEHSGEVGIKSTIAEQQEYTHLSKTIHNRLTQPVPN